MSVPSRPAPGGRAPDFASEQKLVEIRREAERRGEVKASGIRPAGSPFPMASPDTGYYGIPLLKKPAWTWQIPLYFFTGGTAGAAAVVGAIADYTGADRRLVRDARWIAAAGAIISPALLIADLGRPSRFLNRNSCRTVTGHRFPCALSRMPDRQFHSRSVFLFPITRAC